jgi:prepilin-type N-terminal cleavage/methylation domain-containing protein
MKNRGFTLNSGFTLIEVMIVVAIIALVVLVTAPLSGHWVTDANRLEAEGQLNQAVGRAKASALRNYMGATGNTAVTAICLSNDNVLTVLEGTPGTPAVSPDCTTGTGTQLWRGKLHANITVQADAADFSCMCFDNRATPTSSCNTCSTSTKFSLTAGGETEPVAVY